MSGNNVNDPSKRTRPDCSGLSGFGGDQLYLKRIKIDAPYTSQFRTQTLQDADGTIALTNQIPSSDGFVTLVGNQTINSQKTFAVNPKITAISSPSDYVISIPNVANGTLALTSQIPTNSDYVDRSTDQSINGIKTFNGYVLCTNQYGLFQWNVCGCTLYSSVFTNGLGGFQVDTSLQGNGMGILRLPSMASNASYTFPSSSCFLSGTVGSYPTQSSQGLTLRDAQTISDASYLDGATINCGSSTYTDSVTAASGTVTQVSDVLLGARTLNASNTAVTYSNASTLRVEGAPVAGTNVTMTNRNAIQVDSGNVLLTNGRLISTAVGTAGSPAITVGTNSGLYANGANLLFSTNGVLRATLSGTLLTFASGVGITCAGSSTITSGSGGFTTSGPVSSSLASSATACSIRPTNTANTGIYGNGATSVSIAIGGNQIANHTSTGLSVIGSVQASTAIYSPVLRPITGQGITCAPATDSATGTGTLLVTPSIAGWASGGSAQLNLGDTQQYIRASFGAGMEISSFDSIKLGASGVGFKNMRYGSTSTSIVIIPSSFTTISVSFGVTFSSTPVVIVSLTAQAGSSNWTLCHVAASSVTSTAFDATIRNNSGSNTSGACLVNWIAFNV